MSAITVAEKEKRRAEAIFQAQSSPRVNMMHIEAPHTARNANRRARQTRTVWPRACPDHIVVRDRHGDIFRVNVVLADKELTLASPDGFVAIQYHGTDCIKQNIEDTVMRLMRDLRCVSISVDWRSSYSTSVPYLEIKQQFETPIDTVEVFFISTIGETLRASEQNLQPSTFSGQGQIRARLDIKGRLCIKSDDASKTIQTPYFSQVGLKPPRPFDRRQLNLPEVLPEEN
jgi:hypothetical protein